MSMSMIIVVTKNPIVIPPPILKQAGIKAGDLVEFTAKPGRITIRKVSKTKPS